MEENLKKKKILASFRSQTKKKKKTRNIEKRENQLTHILSFIFYSILKYFLFALLLLLLEFSFLTMGVVWDIKGIERFTVDFG